MTFDLMSKQRVPYSINKPSLVPIGLQLFKCGHFYIFSHIKVPTLNKPSLVPIELQLDFQMKWILRASYNLTSDDLWPWYVTCDLINKWGFPCCSYDPTLVEIHPSMLKVSIEPNVNLFSQQTTDNNRGQSDPYVYFLLRQVTQKSRLLPDLKPSQNVPKHLLFKLCKLHERINGPFLLHIKMWFIMLLWCIKAIEPSIMPISMD